MVNRRVEVPCRDCADRACGCHSTCEAYARYRAEINARNEVRLRKKGYEFDLTRVELQRCAREHSFDRRNL